MEVREFLAGVTQATAAFMGQIPDDGTPSPDAIGGAVGSLEEALSVLLERFTWEELSGLSGIVFEVWRDARMVRDHASTLIRECLEVAGHPLLLPSFQRIWRVAGKVLGMDAAQVMKNKLLNGIGQLSVARAERMLASTEDV